MNKEWYNHIGYESEEEYNKALFESILRAVKYIEAQGRKQRPFKFAEPGFYPNTTYYTILPTIFI